jgi:hypothetical protein
MPRPWWEPAGQGQRLCMGVACPSGLVLEACLQVGMWWVEVGRGGHGDALLLLGGVPGACTVHTARANPPAMAQHYMAVGLRVPHTACGGAQMYPAVRSAVPACGLCAAAATAGVGNRAQRTSLQMA